MKPFLFAATLAVGTMFAAPAGAVPECSSGPIINGNCTFAPPTRTDDDPFNQKPKDMTCTMHWWNNCKPCPDYRDRFPAPPLTEPCDHEAPNFPN